MYFDKLMDSSIKTHEKNELYNICVAAEENARIRPNESVVNSRKALEIFIASILADHSIHIPSNYEEKKQQELDNLDKQIKKCRNTNIIDTHTFKLLDNIRRESNKIVHVSYNDSGVPEYKIINIDADIKLASEIVKSLYEAIINHFKKNTTKYTLDVSRLPFGKYEVLQLVNKTAIEATATDHNYICQSITYGENNRQQKSWVYIRAFEKNTQQPHHKRDNTVLYEVWETGDEMPVNIVRGDVIETSRECGYTYIKYKIGEDTFTLANREKLGEVTGIMALGIIEKLIKALISIQNVKEGTKIHHRSIRPEFVFITPTKNGLNVQLGCFETSKIEKEDENEVLPTVMPYAMKNQGGNPFSHNSIRDKNYLNVVDVDWEKVDVHSLGVLLLWVLGDNILKNKSYDFNILMDYYEEDFLEFMESVLENSLKTKPTLEQFLQAVKDEAILIGK